MNFVKNSEIKDFKVKGNKVLTTIVINGYNITNPTLEQFQSTGWREYVPDSSPVLQPYIPTYKQLVVEKIRERYDFDDEIAILRQRESKPDEFAEYNTYCERCKTEAKTEINYE